MRTSLSLLVAAMLAAVCTGCSSPSSPTEVRDKWAGTWVGTAVDEQVGSVAVRMTISRTPSAPSISGTWTASLPTPVGGTFTGLEIGAPPIALPATCGQDGGGSFELTADGNRITGRYLMFRGCPGGLTKGTVELTRQ